MEGRAATVGRWDGWGQTLSLLCMAHCLLLPLGLGALPALAAEAVEEAPLHLLLVVLAGAVALASFGPGFRHHRDGRVLALGGAGLALLGLAQGALSEGPVETGVTVAGAALLLGAHRLNRRHARTCCPPEAAPGS